MDNNLHQQFIQLGRERNKITYKLLALLPKIYDAKIYEKHSYATIYEYAGKLAGLSYSVVEKALKLEEKLKDKPCLQKAIETQGIHKVAIVAHLATPENEKVFADKIENMSKTAVQEWSKELRGKIQTSWQIEMDEEMMTMFLKLKKKLGENLSNKEAMRRMLKKIEGGSVGEAGLGELGVGLSVGGCGGAGDAVPRVMVSVGSLVEAAGAQNTENDPPRVMAKNIISRTQAQNPTKIPGDFYEIFLKSSREEGEKEKCFGENPKKESKKYLVEGFGENPKITRYIPATKKREILAATNGKCSHQHCARPAQILHHQIRFSQMRGHNSVIPLCKTHHEFAHNGITEPMDMADFLYRDYRQAALT